MSISRSIFALSIMIGLTGCSSQPGTIFKSFDLTGTSSVTTGARQRAIVNRPVGPLSRPGRVHPANIICAEPSPDVAIAVSQSLSAGISVFGKGSGSASQSTAEGLAELAGRTATAQLLRDQMYRSCEAYANGAISEVTYSLLMSRINDTMVTLLLSEAATGALKQKRAGIAGGATAKATADTTSKKPGSAEGGNNNEDEAETSSDTTVTVTVQPGGSDQATLPVKEVAASLATMQASFLADDASRSLVSACIVEMTNQFSKLSGAYAETTGGKDINAEEEVLRGFAASWKQLSKAFSGTDSIALLKNGKKGGKNNHLTAQSMILNPEVGREMEKARTAVMEYARLLGETELTTYCKSNVLPHLEEMRARRQQHAETQTYAKMFSSCDSIKDPDKKNACLGIIKDVIVSTQ